MGPRPILLVEPLGIPLGLEPGALSVGLEDSELEESGDEDSDSDGSIQVERAAQVSFACQRVPPDVIRPILQGNVVNCSGCLRI